MEVKLELIRKTFRWVRLILEAVQIKKVTWCSILSGNMEITSYPEEV